MGGSKMIKLKDILNERQQLTEKQEAPPGLIKIVSQMTDRNNHTEARWEIAKRLKNKKLEKFYQAMSMLNDVFGGYGPELSKLNTKMEKELYRQLVRTFKNYDDIYNAL